MTPARYEITSPGSGNWFTFRPGTIKLDYASWPALTSIGQLPTFSGVVEKRHGRLMGFEKPELASRIRKYMDPSTSFEELQAAGIGPVEDMARFKARIARLRLLREEQYSDDALRQVALHPFDSRWAYHTTVRPIWNEPRPELAARAFSGNAFMVARLRSRRRFDGLPIFWSTVLPGDHLLDPNTHPIPVLSSVSTANLSPASRAWLTHIGIPDPDSDRAIAALPWHHALAIGYSPAWLTENADGIRQDWPRVPLPNTADLLRASAALGARIAALLDPEDPVPGVTAGTPHPAIRTIGVITRQGGGSVTEADRALTAGWGHAGKRGAVMPGRGRVVSRPFTPEEADTQQAFPGEQTNDIYLNDAVYWRNIPDSVWDFTIGGYQVLKKWLSYRERPLLGRPLSLGELRHVTGVARRLAALRLMAPDLDTNYRACAAAHHPLPEQP